MKLLSFETSGRHGSLAVLEMTAGQPTAQLQRDLPAEVRSAQSIGPALQSLLSETGWQTSELDAVAVASGPGSFTGLRVGVTAAKMLAFVAHCPVVEVGTLDVLAHQAAHQAGPVWAVLDAQRQEVFAAKYEAGHPTPKVQLLAADALVAQLASGDRIIGTYAAKLTLPAGVTLIEGRQAMPQAETVARLAAELFAEGKFTSPDQLPPRYHRLSAAEEKKLRAEASS